MKKTHLFILLSLLACGVVGGPVVAMERNASKDDYLDTLQKLENKVQETKQVYKDMINNCFSVLKKIKKCDKNDREEYQLEKSNFEKAVQEREIAKTNLFFAIQEFEIFQKHNQLFVAIEQNNINLLRNLLKDDDININVRSFHKNLRNATLLHCAICRGNKEIIKLLLDNDANVDVIDQAGKTPLHYAVIFKNKKIVKLLLDNYAKVDAKDQADKTPLFYAIIANNKEIKNILLEKNEHLEGGWIIV